MAGVGEGARNAAAALAATTGGATVQLRMPAPAVATDMGEELGLRTPQFQVRPLVPVAWDRSAKATSVLVAAPVLEDLLGLSDAGAVRIAMQAVDAVLADDEVFDLLACQPVTVGGSACLYRLTLRLRTEVS